MNNEINNLINTLVNEGVDLEQITDEVLRKIEQDLHQSITNQFPKIYKENK